MAIGITYKSRVASTTGATSYTCSPTWTPAAQSLAIAFVVTCLAATPLDPTTVTGHGVSYSKLTLSARTLSTTHAVSIWVAKMGASPTSVACVASYGATQTGGLIIEFEVTGHDNSGTELAAIIQNPTDTGTATSGSVTLAGASGADNRPMSFWLHLTNEVTNPKSSPAWTETSGADGNFTNPPTGGEAQFITSQFDTAPTASWSTSSLWRGVAIEIKAALAAYSLNVDPGTYGVTGISAGTLAARMIEALPSSYVITGLGTLLNRGFLINAALGTYTVNGLDTLLSRGFLLIATPGAYVLTGFDAELLKSTTGFFLLADPGSYVVSGAVAGLLAGRVLNAESGIYVVSGVDAAIVAGRILATDPGAYVVTGSQASTLAQRLIKADPGGYGITGIDASLRLSDVVMSAGVGTYVIIGSAAKALLEVDVIIGGGTPPTVEEIAGAVWTHADAEFLLACINNEKYLSKDGTTWYLTIKNESGTGNILRKALKDKNDNDITDIQAGILVKELANSA